MRTLVSIHVFFLTLCTNAQITGTVLDSGNLPLPGVEIKFLNVEASTSDIDGNFILSIPENKKTSDLVFNYYPNYGIVKTEIKNFPLQKNGNLKINLLSLKQIFDEELKNLSKAESENVVADVCLCYSKRLYYYHKDQLEQKYLTVFYNSEEHKIYNFKFEVENQKIIVDWNEVK